jgi:hypothetical protein
MGKSRTAGRKLDPVRVQMAQRTQLAKHELAMKMVAERVKVDAEFAADVLKVAGEGLRPEIRKDAEETIERLKANMEHAGGIGNAIGLHVMKHGSLPESMKAVPVNVPIETVDVSKEKLQETLETLSQNQAEKLKEAGLS